MTTKKSRILVDFLGENERARFDACHARDIRAPGSMHEWTAGMNLLAHGMSMSY